MHESTLTAVALTLAALLCLATFQRPHNAAPIATTTDDPLATIGPASPPL